MLRPRLDAEAAARRELLLKVAMEAFYQRQQPDIAAQYKAMQPKNKEPKKQPRKQQHAARRAPPPLPHQQLEQHLDPQPAAVE